MKLIKNKNNINKRKRKNNNKNIPRLNNNLGSLMFKVNSIQSFKRKLLPKWLDLNLHKNAMQVHNLLFLLLLSNHKCQKLLKILNKRINNTYKKLKRKEHYKKRKNNNK